MNQRYTPRDRYPRTLEEAFGPYADGREYKRLRRPMDWQDRVVLWGCVLAVGAALLIVWLEGKV